MNFKINSRPLFTIIFKLKNDNFKTRDFSPLIERVLAGVEQAKGGTYGKVTLGKNFGIEHFSQIFTGLVVDTYKKI